MTNQGLVRVATVSPHVEVADPFKNISRIHEKYELLAESGCSVVLTPELSITAYSCEDLFFTHDLIEQSNQALLNLVELVDRDCLLVVGAPLRLDDGRLLNVALVLANQTILGAVPKIANPNYAEFYEKRWYASGMGVASTVQLGEHSIRVSAKQLFRCGTALCGIEICEDLWLPQPPSAQHAINGATLILNPSASPEQIAKSDYRRDLVRMQSGSCICGYAYAGASYTESTKDVVYGGHMLIAENASLICESERFISDSMLIADIDCQKLTHERSVNSSFHGLQRDESYQIQGESTEIELGQSLRSYKQQPFVPEDESTLHERAQEILNIQCSGLERRVRAAKAKTLVIGLSGGLDSTLAFLVCIETLKRLAWNVDQILAVTMPGPGTSRRTLESVKRLTDATQATLLEIEISDLVKHQLNNIQHESTQDTTFENIQARTRTQTLFSLANKHQGIVVGTGDLSELALGWCTFNGDHMSNYNVNVSVPKTLVSHLVNWYSNNTLDQELSEVLQNVLSTPISPELLPSSSDDIEQRTEDIIGPYELHDFFLYHFTRTGAGARKILLLAQSAFKSKYSIDDLNHWLREFFTRFHQQQFKRTTLPPGPKVGTVSLSPRGDWRMPDESQWVSPVLEGY